MREEDIYPIVQQSMSAKRFRHVEGVVLTAGSLARLHGADERSARLAALIHDYAREWDFEKLRRIASRQPGLLEEAIVPELLHGPVAALVLRETFGIEDDDIANAIRYHTTGREGMSVLERIVCLADAIEPNREYPGVDEIRRISEQNLTKALAMSFDSTIGYLLLHRRPISVVSVATRNELWQEVETK